MQNILRFALASYVVFFHIGNYYFPNAGPFAVFGFYTLSGYLITRVLNEVYYQKQHPARDFFINRFWRLYPPYFAAAALGLLMAIFAANEANYWNPAIHLPNQDGTGSALEWLWMIPNLTIAGLHFGLPISSPIRFSPPSWTTAIEIYFYIFLFFVGARSALGVKRWVGISIALVLAITMVLLGVPDLLPTEWLNTEKLFYSNVFGVSICFALGSWAYYWSRQKAEGKSSFIGTTSFAVALVLPLIPWRYIIAGDTPIMLVHYAECLAVAVFLLHAGDREVNLPTRFFADLSYPLFLVHWQVAILLSALGLGIVKNGWFAVVAVYGSSILIALLINRLIEEPLKAVRTKIRNRE